MEREVLISVAIGATIVALLLFVLFRILWRNLAQTFVFAAVCVFAFGWWRESRISPPYVACAIALLTASVVIKWLRRPRPMTSERLFSIVAPSVEVSSASDRILLQSICDDTLIDPNFKDHWNAVDYNPGKRTSRAQCERIRELGYTGKIPKNMRAASALIEVLTIIKRYNAEKAHNAINVGASCGGFANATGSQSQSNPNRRK